MSVIGDLASGIFVNEFGSNTGNASISSISGWLTHNLGLLNTNINTVFSGTDPAFQNEEKAIFTQLYLGHYYQRQAMNALRNIVTDVNGIVEIQEGDTKVVLANKNEVSKTFRGLSRDSFEQARMLTHSYNMYESKPSQVVGWEVSPTGRTLNS